MDQSKVELKVETKGGELNRHKTQKKPTEDAVHHDIKQTSEASFANLLEDSAREAYTRPWHRIERGLRLNRLRIFVEDISPQYDMTKEDKDSLFLFLQKALDKKLLNTLKIVNYDQETQRITMIKGLEIKRADVTPEGILPKDALPKSELKWGFSAKKPKTIETRKRKKEEVPSVSTKLETTVSTIGE